jgi:hypothetical protein
MFGRETRREEPVDAVGTEFAYHPIREALAGAYAPERELGRGGMATVYLARDLRHRRPVAVKVLHPELSAVLGPERFLREIELTASLQHPHVLPLFDSGEAGGLLYYVMPYVEGGSLRARLLRGGPLPLDDATRIAREVAEALAYAHGRGVVHRDVKPENILLQQGHALVADFGIALAVEQAGGARMTRTGLSLGTPQYMAPEQAMGERVVDARTDIYALGVVLYEMLAGEAPFTGPTAQAVLARLLTERPRPLTAVRDTVPAHVDAAVRTALAQLPADRFASADAFAAALAGPGPAAAARRGAAPAATPRGGGRAGRRRGRRRPPSAGGRAHVGPGGRRPPRGRPPVRFAVEARLGGRRLHHAAGALAGRPRRGLPGRRAGRRPAVRAAPRRDRVAPARRHRGPRSVPFFSPDGAWVAFYSKGALRRVRGRRRGAAVVGRCCRRRRCSSAARGAPTARSSTPAPGPRSTASRRTAGTRRGSRVADTGLRLVHPQPAARGRRGARDRPPDYRPGRVGVPRPRLRARAPVRRRASRRATWPAPRLQRTTGALYRQPFLTSTGSSRSGPRRAGIAVGLDPRNGMGARSAFDGAPNGTLV